MTPPTTAARTMGIHHAGLTVPDLEAAKGPARIVPFDRYRNVGLHHRALRVADASALDRLHGELAGRPDTAVELAPEPLGGGPTRHMMCAIPGGIRLELIAPAAQ